MFLFISFRMNMSAAPSVEGSSTLSREQISANRAITYTLLYAAFRYGEYDALREHVKQNPVPQYFSDSLSYGIRLVVNKTQTMSRIAPTLIILLQHGAKWHGDDLHELTPYHVICQSHGDHHELLHLMINEIGRELVNKKNNDGHTALTYAVHNTNVKCLEVLIANGGDVNAICNTNLGLHKDVNAVMIKGQTSPLLDSISLLCSDNYHSSNIVMDIFDLLLESGANVNTSCNATRRPPIMYAVELGNVKCVQKLIEKGADLHHSDRTGCTVWSLAAQSGNVDVLKCLLEDNNIDKNSVDSNGLSVLYWAVRRGKIEAVRYLLHLGVETTTYSPMEHAKPCKLCGKNLPCHPMKNQIKADPYMLAISLNLLEVVKLMEDCGCDLYKSEIALSIAVRMNSKKVLNYLLCNYKYSLNFEYIDDSLQWNSHQTLLTKACQQRSGKMVKLLLEYGADPNAESCTCSSAIVAAIHEGHVEIVACFIRSGVNLNHKSICSCNVFDNAPFEVAVSHNNLYAAKMLLVSGCSYGMYSLDKSTMVTVGITPKLQELLKEWNVSKNNVLPLQQRCRMLILNHLSPQAHKKITELPLPPPLIRYLDIPELDNIAEDFKKKPLGVKRVLEN